MTTAIRERWSWSHPALYEIALAVEPCIHTRGCGNGVRPCSTSEHMKREQWCRNCVAWAALKELDELLKEKP